MADSAPSPPEHVDSRGLVAPLRPEAHRPTLSRTSLPELGCRCYRSRPVPFVPECRLRRRTLILSCLLPLLALGPVAAVADGRPGTLYAEVQLGANGVRHSERDFVSPVASASLGLWVLPNIGLEAFADTEIDRGSDDGFEAGVSEAFGAALRFSSPPRDRLRGYLVLGYVDYTVTQEPNGGGREVDERFSGARFGIGLQQRLVRLPGVLVGAEYRNFYNDEAIQVDGLMIGLRLDVR